MTYSKLNELSYWYWAKISLGVFWFFAMFFKVLNPGICSYPVGICKLYTFEPLFGNALGRYSLIGVMMIAVWFYIKERYMLWTTLVLFSISLIIITYQESSGNFARATVYTTVWGAQFLAYLLYNIDRKFDINRYIVQFSIQMVAAAYTLAGIAKLKASGIGWIYDGPNFSLQVIKNYYFLYADSGHVQYLDKGMLIADFIVQHPLTTALLLGSALLLEFGCLIVLVSDRTRIIWGIGLVGMHLGIAYIMGIGISAIAFPMVILFINPLYWLVLFKERVLEYLRANNV